MLGCFVHKDLDRRSHVASTRLRHQTYQLSHDHQYTNSQCVPYATEVTIYHRGAVSSVTVALYMPLTLPPLLSTEFPAKVLFAYQTNCDLLFPTLSLSQPTLHD